jgi:hypothetical protein
MTRLKPGGTLAQRLLRSMRKGIPPRMPPDGGPPPDFAATRNVRTEHPPGPGTGGDKAEAATRHARVAAFLDPGPESECPERGAG